MFKKVLATISIARAGAKAAADIQRKLDAVTKADTVVQDGHPDVENLRNLGEEIKKDGLALFEKCKQAALIVKGLILVAEDA